MRRLVSIAAVTVAVLACGPVVADESVATPADRDIVYAIGGAAEAPDVEDTGSGSLWTDLRHFLADATVTLGADPVGDDPAGRAVAGYNAHADVGLSGFKIGGRFTQFGDAADGTEVDQSFGFGASYSLESLTVGIDWSRGNYDEVFLDVGGSDAGDVIAFTSSYALRPGVRVNGLLEYSETAPAETGPDEGAFTVGIGTLISF